MKKIARPLFLITVFMALAASILVLTAAVMTRTDPLSFRMALTVFRYGVYIAVATAVLSLVAAYATAAAQKKNRILISVMIFLISGFIVFQANRQKTKALALPLIHDITTDTEHPPEFQAIVPIRQGSAVNSLVYEGPRIADQQRQAYPEIQPLDLEMSRHLAFHLALQVVRDMGWKIIHHSEAEGHIEATDTTAFFGFKDDIVIRLTDLNGKTRLDIRSISRVGLSDIGANAGRIRAFLERANQEKTKPAYRSSK